MSQPACTPVIYWIGSTTERFTISDTLINETSNVLIDPNSGTDSLGTHLNFAWIATNFNVVNKFTFRGNKHHIIDLVPGDSHVLMIVPTTILVSGIGETVLGTLALMTSGLHYYKFQITNSGQTYDIYYLRDLTNFVFPKRQFQFDVLIA